MFAEEVLTIIRSCIVETEASTLRAVADKIRDLPAGFPPSELADTLDALAATRQERFQEETEAAAKPPLNEDSVCRCGHTAHWHGMGGIGACTHQCDCKAMVPA